MSILRHGHNVAPSTQANYRNGRDPTNGLDNGNEQEYYRIVCKAGHRLIGKETPMNRKYDVFEKFPDGSSLWRACVLGLDSTRFHLQELAKKSENQFYAIDIWSGKIVAPDLKYGGMQLSAARKVGRRGKSAAA